MRHLILKIGIPNRRITLGDTSLNRLKTFPRRAFGTMLPIHFSEPLK